MARGLPRFELPWPRPRFSKEISGRGGPQPRRGVPPRRSAKFDLPIARSRRPWRTLWFREPNLLIIFSPSSRLDATKSLADQIIAVMLGQWCEAQHKPIIDRAKNGINQQFRISVCCELAGCF